MENLFILNEIITNNFNYNFLNMVSIVSILCGIMIIISKNPVVSVLFLIGLFLSIAGYLMLLGINFIGLSYLLVYVGAVSILFLFILMLINVRISELVTDNSNSIPLAIMIIIFANLNQLFPKTIEMPFTKIRSYNHEVMGHIEYDNKDIILTGRLDDLFIVTSQSWDTRLAETFHITSIGNIIYTNFPI